MCRHLRWMHDSRIKLRSIDSTALSSKDPRTYKLHKACSIAHCTLTASPPSLLCKMDFNGKWEEATLEDISQDREEAILEEISQDRESRTSRSGCLEQLAQAHMQSGRRSMKWDTVAATILFLVQSHDFHERSNQIKVFNRALDMVPSELCVTLCYAMENTAAGNTSGLKRMLNTSLTNGREHKPWTQAGNKCLASAEVVTMFEISWGLPPMGIYGRSVNR